MAPEPHPAPLPRPPRRLARLALRAAALLLVVYSVWLVTLYVGQRALLFPGQFMNRGIGSSYSRGQPLVIDLPDLLPADAPPGTTPPSLPAIFVRPFGAASSAKLPVVIFFHGNAETSAEVEIYRLADRYVDAGMAVLIPEYRGYAGSPGSPSQAAIARDMIAFYDLLVARPDIDPARVIAHGRSLGAAVALELSRSRPLAGVVLEAPFTSVRDFARRYLAPRWLVSDPFDNTDAIAKLRIPIIILHGTRDQVTPVAHGRRLHELAPGSTYVELDADHFNLFERPEFNARIAQWLRDHALAPAR
jgi:fermentation-respiration switch protein FrsA (DUF1100 family)